MTNWQYPSQDSLIIRVATQVDYWVSPNDNLVGVDSTGGPVTLTLPSALVLEAGHSIIVKDERGAAVANPITVVTEGAETIDGLDTSVINTAYGARAFYAADGNWSVL